MCIRDESGTFVCKRYRSLRTDPVSQMCHVTAQKISRVKSTTPTTWNPDLRLALESLLHIAYTATTTMAANRRVPLSAVRYINFHSDTVTLSQRGAPISESRVCVTAHSSHHRRTHGHTDVTEQQTCIGEPCARFQPPIIQCENIGSDGVGGYQWKVRHNEAYADR